MTYSDALSNCSAFSKYLIDSAEISHPVSIPEADFSKPFIFDKSFGFFYVKAGFHTKARYALHVLKLEINANFDCSTLNYPPEQLASLLWLKERGNFFKSSASKKIQVFSPDLLYPEDKILINRKGLSYSFISELKNPA